MHSKKDPEGARWGVAHASICVLGFNPVETDKMPIQINHYVVKSLNEYKEKSKKGDACFKENGHNMSYFYEHERKSQFADFHIFRYLSELKLNIEESYKLEKVFCLHKKKFISSSKMTP